MPFSTDADLKYIADGIRSHTLPKSEWTHAAHFAAALWLFEDPNCDPFNDMPGIIRAYNLATGTPNSDDEGYHETITIASLRASEHVLKTRVHGMPLHEVLATLLSGPYGRSQWLLEYWSKSVLFSVKARRTWVDPDLKALPF